jgi:hypothetical protein
VRPSFECLLLGEDGGDMAFSTALAASMTELRWLRANRSLSICSADTIVCVPPSLIRGREFLTTELELIVASGVRPSRAVAVSVLASACEFLLHGNTESKNPALVDSVACELSPLVLAEEDEVDNGGGTDRWAVAGREAS